MLKILMLTSTIAFSGLIGLGAVYGHSNNDQQNETNHLLVKKEKVKTDLRKYATYNDELYSITFTADELNNYTWDNFNSQLLNYDNINVASSSTYNSQSVTPSYNVSVNSGNACTTFYSKRRDADTYLGIGFNQMLGGTDLTNNKFTIYIFNSSTNSVSEVLSFDYDFTIVFDSSYYNAIKTAIQADIDANQSTSMPTIADIFNEITSAVTAFVGSLGEAFNSVTALFYDSTNSSWTFLGVLILIGVGVGLIYLAYRVIKGLMHRV